VPRVSIASGSQRSADAGAAVADAGGNAVDAAIGAALTSMCTDPGIIAPGASGFVTVWPPDEDPVVVDGYAEMPGRGLPPERIGANRTEVHLGYGGGMTTLIGHSSVATPGAFAAFGTASERYGRVPWSTVLDPVIGAVEHGFPLSGAAAEYLAYSHEAIFGWDPDSRAVVHHPDGTHLVEGDTVHIPDLADTLGYLAERGAAAFYTGDLAERIGAEIEGNGGLLTAADLAAYRAEVREPIRISVDEWEVATNPPPAVGGATLAAILLLVDDHPFSDWDRDEVARLARVQRAVLGYRRRYLDPSDDRAAIAADLLEKARLGDPQRLLSAPSTIHTSAVDGDGLACSVTVSAGYGSGLMIPGTGMWMNNSLGEVELHPHGFHGLPPGTRLASNMAPTIARRGDGSVLAIGSPGADRITTAISSVLLNYIHLGMSLRDAVAHPRLHVESFNGVPTIAFEPGLPVEPIDDLVTRRFPDLSMYFGGVQTALWDPVAGHFEAADPRRAGGVATGG
jgi:gamma-glutamyltranspeptidase / glutathione hydrolase